MAMLSDSLPVGLVAVFMVIALGGWIARRGGKHG